MIKSMGISLAEINYLFQMRELSGSDAADTYKAI